MQNSQENSVSTRLNLQTQTHNSLFELLYIVNDKHPLRYEIHEVLAVLNSVIILLTYLSLKQINLFSPFIKLNNQIVVIALFSVLALVVVQLVLGLLYGKQLFLKLQFLVYRSIVFPIAFLSAVGHSPIVVPTSIVYIIAGVCTIAVLLLEWLIGKQYFARNLLVQRGFPLSAYMLLFQILLSLHTINSIECKRFIVIVMVMLSLYIRFGVMGSNQRHSKCRQYTIFKIKGTLNIIYTVFLTYAQIADVLSQQKQSFIFIFALVIFVVIAQFSAEYADCMKPLPLSFFNATDNATMFLLRAQYVIDDLDKLANSESVQISNTVMIPIYYQHINKCKRLECGIAHQLQSQVLSNSGHYKILCSTVFRIFQQLFINYILTQPENVDLKLGFIKFYLRGGPNKIKIMQLIAQLEKCQLSFEDKIKTYSMKRFVTDIDIVEFVESMKIQDAFHHFNQSVSALMRLLIEFWTQFLDERVDFQKVLQTAEKITPILGSIQGQIQQTIKVQNYSTIRIMKIYAQHSRWIMNDDMKSAMISDYVHLLNKKMSQIHEINCINADMEIGLIAISLQVKKLGEIKIANNQAANIFNYSKPQFIKTNVNSIMPSIFAKFHDDFLKVFLVNEHKKVNTDRRLIIGKKREGYLFEIYLQLQKSVITNFQQFIFIANIEVAKLHEAPILVICDDKGLITDFNSTYKQIFDKSWKRSKSHQHTTYTNIQQVIPSFFEIVLSDAAETKTTVQCYDNPTFGIIQIKFEITKISFKQCPDAGYSIKGHRIKEPKEEFFNKLSLTQTLMDTAEERDLRGMKVQYLPINNQYQFNERLDVYGCGQFNSEYTIPYVKLDCFGQILNQNYQIKTVPQYDAEIKTLRFCGDHFERVEEAESFQSEITEELKTKITDLKLNLIKQSIQNQEDYLNQKLPTIFVILFAFIGIILLSTFYVFVTKEKTQALEVIQQSAKASEFRSQLAEYVLYFQAQSDPQYGEFFTQQKQTLKAKLIDQITKVNLPQTQKQRALRIIYLQEALKTTKFQELISDETFMLPLFNKVSLQNRIFTAFKVLIGVFILSKIVLNLMIMHWHRNKLINILSLFLVLSETDIKKSHKKCVQFLKDSNEALNKMEQKISICDDGTQSDQQQNPHIKIRKFKNISLGKSLVNFMKLNVFNVLLFIIFGIMLANDAQKNKHFNSQIVMYQYVANVVPEYSTKMMLSYSKNVLGKNLKIKQQFVQKYQTLDFYLVQHSSVDSILKQNFFSIMYTNQCENSNFNLPKTIDCAQIANGVMLDGVVEAVNLLALRLNSIQSSPPSTKQTQQLNELSILLFHMVQPVIMSIHEERQAEISAENIQMHTQILIMFILLLLTLLIDLVYLTHYPLHDIAKNIIHSKVLIQLIPQLKKKTQKNGYTQI